MTLKKLTKEEAQKRLAIIESSGVLPQEAFESLKILADSVIDSGGTTEDVLAAFNALVPAETNDENFLDAIDAIRVSYPNRDRPLADYPEIEERVTDSLLAVYVAKGLFEKTVENMNHLRSKGTIDFVGKLQIAVESDLALGQRDEIRGELSATEHSEAVLKNRSDVYDRIESVFAFCFDGPQQSIDSLCQLELKDLTRFVSQSITH